MMKKILFCFSVICLSGIISAQRYTPMLDSTNIWSYSQVEITTKIKKVNQEYCNYPRGSFGFTTEYTSSDTLLNGFRYKKLYSTSMGNPIGCLFGWVREDTAMQTIYFRDLDSAESILYNFSMKIHDSILVKNIDTSGYAYFKSGYYRLDSIKSIILNSRNRIRFDLNCHKCGSPHTLSWVEGIGNLGDFIYSYQDFNTAFNLFSGCSGFPYNTSQILTCFQHTAKIYYDSCALQSSQTNRFNFSYTDSCDYFGVLGGIEKYNSILKFEIMPNPASSVLTIKTSTENQYSLLLLNILGQVVYKSVNIPVQEFSFDVSGLPKGIYVVQSTDLLDGKIVRQKLVIE